MKKMFFLLTIAALLMVCCSDNEETNNSMLGPIDSFLIRLIDTDGNWIEGIEEKEMKLVVADSNWNILDEQPNNAPGTFYDHPLWWIEKHYNYVENGKEEFIGGKKELLSLDVTIFFKYIKNDKTYGNYIVLQIDENTSLNIQLFYKEFYNHAGPCIEKFICNGKEYINIESVTNYRYGKDGVKEVKINDIVIE